MDKYAMKIMTVDIVDKLPDGRIGLLGYNPEFTVDDAPRLRAQLLGPAVIRCGSDSYLATIVESGVFVTFSNTLNIAILLEEHAVHVEKGCDVFLLKR